MGWKGDAETLYTPVDGSELLLLPPRPLAKTGVR
jgi:hypothetical protein